jgi:hypothetical protein
MCGVAGSWIESTLRTDHGQAWGVANLGYCRPGRNLQYAVLKDLLRVRLPAHVVLEVGHHEPHYSHPMFPYVADAEDIVGAPVLTNKAVVSDLWDGVVVRFERWRQTLLYDDGDLPPVDERPHAFREQTRRAPIEILERRKRRWAGRAASTSAPGDDTSSRRRFGRHYLDSVIELAKRHDVQVHFLYLPAYGAPWAVMEEEAVYRRHGDLWVPPREIFEEPAHWMDESHLNAFGARKLATWLAERIAQLER